MKEHRIRITAVILSILINLFSFKSNSDFFILSCCSECRGMLTDIHHSQKKKKKSIALLTTTAFGQKVLVVFFCTIKASCLFHVAVYLVTSNSLDTCDHLFGTFFLILVQVKNCRTILSASLTSRERMHPRPLSVY